MRKRCCHCKQVLDASHFTKDSHTPDGLRRECRECRKERARNFSPEYRAIIRARQNRYRSENHQKVLAHQALYREAHREQLRAKARAYHDAHTPKREKVVLSAGEKEAKKKQYAKEYYKSHKARILRNGAKNYQRHKNDPIFVAKQRCRSRIYAAFSAMGMGKNKRSEEILGCTYAELWEHLKNTWKINYGTEYKGEPCHIDHITPLSYATTTEEVESLCNYANLQLLTPEDNLAKGNKFELKWIL